MMRTSSGYSGLLAGIAMLISFGSASAPVSAQAQQSVKELLNRAQTQSEQRAVEDLITKLRPPGAAPAPAPGASPLPVSVPAAVTAPPPATVAAPTVPSAPAVKSIVSTPPATVSPVQPAAAPPALLPSVVPPTAVVPVSPPSAPSSVFPVAAPVGVSPPPVAFPPSKDIMAKAPEIADKMNLPRADLEVFFEFDKADITPDAMELLKTLGAALADPRLKGSRFVIGGHTDAKGRADYNLALSQRRAEAVRKFVIDNFQVDPNSLVARGFGAQRLKNSRSPLADENRRVQIINWTSQAAVGRVR